MKQHWLDHLGDPNTGDPLQIKAVFREEGGHILDGLLSNAQSDVYPINENIELYGGWCAISLGLMEPTRPAREKCRKLVLSPRHVQNYVHQTGIDDAFYTGKTILDVSHVSYICSIRD